MNAYLSIAALSYLLGSIPFGYLLVRFFRGEDVRSGGSGNIGATNVARRSPALGVATLLLDAGKGLAAVLLAKDLFANPHSKLSLTIAAFFAVLGHLFPIWLKFRGGKGVATGLGSFVLIVPKSILCMVGVFVVVVAIFRYVSLGSVVAASLLPILAWGLHEYIQPRELILLLATSVLIIWKHRKNLSRIAAGSEPRLGAKTK
jgi:glycerol-3-phosphate acyltransferase PlsY